MTYSSCLHDQQDLCWGNTSRDTSEESQESQEKILNTHPGLLKTFHYGMLGHVCPSENSVRLGTDSRSADKNVDVNFA